MKKVFIYVIHWLCITFILFAMLYLKDKYHLNTWTYLVIAVPAFFIEFYVANKIIKANK